TLELLAKSGEENRKHLVGQDLLTVDIERFAEIDVFGIERIPKVVVCCGNDPIEGVATPPVPFRHEHRWKIFRGYGLVSVILGDLDHGAAPRVWKNRHLVENAGNINKNDARANSLTEHQERRAMRAVLS